jgi:predicted nucleic acid-binding protein
MKFLDTNIFVRLLAADDEKKTDACFRLFQRIQRGEESVTTAEVIIAEVVYVLSSPSLYHLSHEEIAARLAPILSLRSLQLRYKRTYLRALDLYATHPFLDFEDALAVVHMERQGISEIVTYDRDFDRLPGIKRIEP